MKGDGRTEEEGVRWRERSDGVIFVVAEKVMCEVILRFLLIFRGRRMRKRKVTR